MVELLMVVAIIGILATMTLAVMNGMVEQAQEEATKTTILKINRLLEQRIDGFERAFKGSRREQYIKGTVGLLRQIDGRFDYFDAHPSEAPPAIILLARKAGFRYEFPQRYVERSAVGDTPPTSTGLSAAVRSLTTGIPGSVYRKLAYPIARTQLIEESGGTGSPSVAAIEAKVSANWDAHLAYEAAALRNDSIPSSESAELLYFTLTASGSFGSSPVDADQFLSVEIGDVDLDGLPEFIDSWGNPIHYYRWPTRLVDPTAPNPFAPDFDTVNDPTEVDPYPDNSEADGLREITDTERDFIGLTLKGIPPKPTPIARPDGSTYMQRDLLLVDPDDPVGILYTFIEDPKYKDMGIDLTEEYNEVKYHTPDTYHAPLIISAGPDGILGLRAGNDFDASMGIFGNLAQYARTTVSAPTPDNAVFDALSDNVTNRNRRAGGRR